MKHPIEDIYEEINELRTVYSKKKTKLKEECQEMIDGNFKKTKDMVNKDRKKYITIVKDWVKDYVENDRGKEHCDKYHPMIYL